MVGGLCVHAPLAVLIHAPSTERTQNFCPRRRPWKEDPERANTCIAGAFAGPRSDPQVILDVQQFSPDEITVKTVDNHVIVEAKHEEKQDEHGYVSRHFVRRYVLPPSHDLVNVTSTLSSDGVLTITAPKKVRSTEPRPALTSALLSHSRRPRTSESFSFSLPSHSPTLPLVFVIAGTAYVTCLIFLPFNSNVSDAVRASVCGIRRGQTVPTGFRSNLRICTKLQNTEYVSLTFEIQ